MKSEELLEIRMELKGARQTVDGFKTTAKAQSELTEAIIAAGKAADLTWRKTTRLFDASGTLAILRLSKAYEQATSHLRKYIGALSDPKLKAGLRGGSVLGSKGAGAAVLTQPFGIPGEAGVDGAKVAAGFVTGFQNSDALGKLLISGWLFKAMGGGVVAGQVGLQLAKALAARFLPELAVELAGAATFTDALGVAAGLAFAAVAPEVLLVAGAVALLGGAFFIAYKKVKWFREGVNGVTGFLKKHWKALPFLAPIAAMIEGIRHWKSVLGKALLFMLGPIGDVVTAFQQWHSITISLGEITGFIRRHLGSILDWLRHLPGKALHLMGEFANSIIEGLEAIPGKIAGLAGEIGESIMEEFQDSLPFGVGHLFDSADPSESFGRISPPKHHLHGRTSHGRKTHRHTPVSFTPPPTAARYQSPGRGRSNVGAGRSSRTIVVQVPLDGKVIAEKVIHLAEDRAALA